MLYDYLTSHPGRVNPKKYQLILIGPSAQALIVPILVTADAPPLFDSLHKVASAPFCSHPFTRLVFTLRL